MGKIWSVISSIPLAYAIATIMGLLIAIFSTSFKKCLKEFLNASNCVILVIGIIQLVRLFVTDKNFSIFWWIALVSAIAPLVFINTRVRKSIVVTLIITLVVNAFYLYLAGEMSYFYFSQTAFWGISYVDFSMIRILIISIFYFLGCFLWARVKNKSKAS